MKQIISRIQEYDLWLTFKEISHSDSEIFKLENDFNKKLQNLINLAEGINTVGSLRKNQPGLYIFGIEYQVDKESVVLDRLKQMLSDFKSAHKEYIQDLSYEKK